MAKRKLNIKLSHPALIILPYILGILWTISHPIVSVVTGELKSRGFYIDEAQLGPGEYQTDPFPLLRGVKSEAFALTNDDETGSGGSNSNSNPVETKLCNVHQRGTSNYRHHHQKSSSQQQSQQQRMVALGQNHPPSSLTCHSHTTFDILKIEPTYAPTRAVESIVLVLPPTDDWMASDVHLSTLILIDRLLDRKWLAKAVLIVSPHYNAAADDDIDVDDSVIFGGIVNEYGVGSHSTSVAKATRDFLAAANGMMGSTNHNNDMPPPLPSSYTHFLIRQLFVLDITTIQPTDDGDNGGGASRERYYILPQGRRGMVPNLDLLATAAGSFSNRAGRYMEVQMHPFGMDWWKTDYVEKYLPTVTQDSAQWLKRLKPWAVDLGYLGAFMASMLVGTGAPHSSALDQGIDSLTIGARIQNKNNNSIDPCIASLFQSTEHLLRGMNSLSERLHHTVNQYILPTSTNFVSHGEYIYPVLLLLLPLVIRAVLLAFVEIDRFEFGAALGALGVCFGGMGLCMVFELVGGGDGHYGFVMQYLLVGLFLVKLGLVDWIIATRSSSSSSGSKKEKENKEVVGRRFGQSVQFTACVLSIYLHVPIGLSHVSLALPSALFWTPLLAFPSYRRRRRRTTFVGWVRHILALLVLVCIWPPMAATLVGLDASTVHSVYVGVVFVPLYLMVSILWLC